MGAGDGKHLAGIPGPLILPHCYFCHVALDETNRSEWEAFADTGDGEVRAVSQCVDCDRRNGDELAGAVHCGGCDRHLLSKSTRECDCGWVNPDYEPH